MSAVIKQKNNLKKEIEFIYDSLRSSNNKEESIKILAETFYDIVSQVSAKDNDVVAYNSKGQPMSRDAFSALIEERIKMSENGDYVSIDEFGRQIDSW